MKKYRRAWIEINLSNLENNINEIKKIIPTNTKIMAVVKANAYGHGAVGVSRELESIGITDFAVATLEEAIELRRAKIKGNILILGYTPIECLKEVIKYDFIQTIIDEDYANIIIKMNFKEKLKGHIKINTGMNRMGIDNKNLNLIEQIYKSNNIEVLGIFSHLSDSYNESSSSKEFTKKQIDLFDNLISSLKNKNINVGNTHIQGSNGILNYPELNHSFVRPGIILYGLYTEKYINTKCKINLKRVLFLKSRIISIKDIKKGSFVGYGRKYEALEDKKNAVVSIGHADGYPRSLSLKNAKVLVNNSYADVVGIICMDYFMIDITNISVKVGDIVTLIGEDENIKAEELASKLDTVTSELVARSGKRLERVYIK